MTAILTGLGLSAAAGLNAWVILLLFHGLFLLMPQEFPGPTAALLSSQGVLTAAIVLFLAEFVADKIPIVDHLWGLAQTLLRPVVGALLPLAFVPDASPGARIGLAAAGALATLATHLAKSATRLTSTAATRGFAQLAMSLAEDAFALALGCLRLLRPVVRGRLPRSARPPARPGSAPGAARPGGHVLPSQAPPPRPAGVMPYLLDGNNLIGLFLKTSRPSAEDRQALISELSQRLRRTRARAILFFDGPAGGRGSSMGTLTIRAASGGTADDAILREIEKTRSPGEMIVVTADRGLSRRARDAGAVVCAPEEFFSRFGKDQPAQAAKPEAGPVDVDAWTDNTSRTKETGTGGTEDRVGHSASASPEVRAIASASRQLDLPRLATSLIAPDGP